MLVSAAVSAVADFALSGRSAIGGTLSVDSNHMFLGDRGLDFRS